MIDMNKKYTYNGKPVRIYADGSDTAGGYIHGAYSNDDGNWCAATLLGSDLVEVWEPKEGELVYLWDDRSDYCLVGKYAETQYGHSFRLSNSDSGKSYSYVAPFIGELPEAFKGLQMKFKVEEYRPHAYRVLIKKWYTLWYSGYIYTSFFDINYDSLELALEAIESYKNRFTELKDQYD